MTRTRLRWFMCWLGLFIGLTAPHAVQAQEDTWTFLFTPQVWLTDIPFNGFGAVGTVASGARTLVGPGTNVGLVDPNITGGPFLGQVGFPANAQTAGSTVPSARLYPQWGGQLAAQHGRWTLGVAAQYVSFETRTELFTTGAPVPCNVFLGSPNSGFVKTVCRVPPNSRIATEGIHTDRVDVDLALSYFVPDVIGDALDVSLGAGVKWIRASGQRTLTANDGDLFGSAGGIVYNLRNGKLATKASFLDNLYGVTFPTTATFLLSSSKKWLLPVTLTPYVGYEERDDQVTGYATSFVKGGTLDVGIRYVFDNGMGLYAGYRGQVIAGNNLYVAYGPLFNLSIPIGGK